MKHSFIDILRYPDSILFQFEDSSGRFEEADGKEEEKARLKYQTENGAGVITLYPSKRPVKRIKLRWRGDMSDCFLVTGDALERMYGSTLGHVSHKAMSSPVWTGMIPDRNMPWYFQVYDGEKLNCFGVKTGADAFCTFLCDESGITLWLDVRNGGGGVRLEEPLRVAEVACREGNANETPYQASRAFCRQMCDNPVLPKEPIFGVNNWYWAYGNISHSSVMEETDNLMNMCCDCVTKPYMIIDDGWQRGRYKTKERISYNGGPWDLTKAGFDSMAETADAIHRKGAKAGIWFRPLRTSVQVPPDWENPVLKDDRGMLLDPSHPDVLNMVYNDTAMIRNWGYELIKHDFTTYDTITIQNAKDGDWHFYNKGITNCTMLKNLYKTIQKAADGADVIGCNTVGHLTAGIHSVQRVSDDTSGHYFEYTRLSGCASYIRLPQNETFFSFDPDCAAFTSQVPVKENLDFLEVAAITGSTTLASVTPGILKGDDLKRVRRIYKIASEGGINAIPTDWLAHNTPSRFETDDGKKFHYDWYEYYDGIRSFYEWYE